MTWVLMTQHLISSLVIFTKEHELKNFTKHTVSGFGMPQGTILDLLLFNVDNLIKNSTITLFYTMMTQSS